MPKLSLLTAALTASESLPASAWPRQPKAERPPFFRTWPMQLLRRAGTALVAHQKSAHLKSQIQELTSGRTLTLGSFSRPLNTTEWSQSLESLQGAPAGAIRLITQAYEPFANPLPLLEADQHHALQVDLVLDDADLANFHRPAWNLLRDLTDLGIAVRICFPYASDLNDQEFHLHRLFEQALAQGALDLLAIVDSPAKTKRAKAPTSWLACFERLRLEYACPRARIGRG